MKSKFKKGNSLNSQGNCPAPEFANCLKQITTENFHLLEKYAVIVDSLWRKWQEASGDNDKCPEQGPKVGGRILWLLYVLAKYCGAYYDIGRFKGKRGKVKLQIIFLQPEDGLIATCYAVKDVHHEHDETFRNPATHQWKMATG